MASRKLVLKLKARKDLQAIWRYTFQHWGGDQADQYLRDIESTVAVLPGNPEIGTACDHIRQGYRKLTVRSHVVFYRFTPKTVEIVRVLHSRMDPEKHIG